MIKDHDKALYGLRYTIWPDGNTALSIQMCIIACLVSFMFFSCDFSESDSGIAHDEKDSDFPGAIHMNSSKISGWAKFYNDYSPGANCDNKWQTPEKALGPAKGDSYDIVCLGDGGSITLSFETQIEDRMGADFAVFENSFSSEFLELAFVEISANGTDFYRFHTSSKTSAPVTEYGTIDFENVYDINNNYTGFSGIHPQGYGTVFDIAAIPEMEGKRITHIRIIDIIGDGNTFDTDNSPIYDPYPQNGSAGFDLDAIAIIRD